MNLDELCSIVRQAGGKDRAMEYAEELLEKINLLESGNTYERLLTPFRSAKNEGDLRGRVLEINFANLFAEKGIALRCATKQGMSGDVDFCWDVKGHEVFIEMKLLGQDQETRGTINQQLKDAGVSETMISDDTRDVARIQRDIFQKSSTTKFNPNPKESWINLVAVDVSELQLGTIDVVDCLLAAGGNNLASRHCDTACLRPQIVGVFEDTTSSLRAEQAKWIEDFHVLPTDASHPREYLHGVLFLFRQPAERAALSYELSSVTVWNPTIIDHQKTGAFSKLINSIFPLP